MRTLSLLLLITVLSISCVDRHSKTFETLDLSININGSNVYCFKVYNNGITNIYNCDPFKSKHYYRLKLNYNQIDSLTMLTKAIINSNNDSIYQCAGDRFGADVLFINTNKYIYKFYIMGSCYKIAGVDTIHKLTHYLYDIANKYQKSLDKDFIFASYSIYLFPPPPSNTDKYETEYYKRLP